jgi:tetratricopeptide (TPR) repeat protein
MKRNLLKAAHHVVKSLRMGNRARGDAARDARDWLGAIQAYEAHLAVETDDTAIWIQLGHAYKEAGSLEDALQAYLRAEALEPYDPDLLLNVGHLHKMRARLDLALNAYDKSASLQPGLFGGAAMIAHEQILGRVTWRSEDHSIPTTVSELIAAVETAEHSGRRIFRDYYNSFEKR